MENLEKNMSQSPILSILFTSKELILKPQNFPKFSEVTLITFTCSKSTIETVDKGVKYVKSYL